MARLFRVLARVLLVLLALIVVAVGVLYAASEWRLRTRYDVRVEPLAIPTDAAALARGRHLVDHVVNCAGCHGADLGGAVFVDAAPIVAYLPAPNLTKGRGGVGGRYTPADWVRAIRHGVAADGRGVLLMPSDMYAELPARDLAAIIADLQSRPPVDRELPSRSVGPIFRGVILFSNPGMIAAHTIDHARPIPAEAPTDLLARGEHLATVSGCTSCHGNDLAGRPEPPPGPGNLTPVGLNGWTEADFVRTLRTSRTPDNRQLDPIMSPAYGQMTDEELHAIWTYLQSVPAQGQKTARQAGRAN